MLVRYSDSAPGETYSGYSGTLVGKTGNKAAFNEKTKSAQPRGCSGNRSRSTRKQCPTCGLHCAEQGAVVLHRSAQPSKRAFGERARARFHPLSCRTRQDRPSVMTRNSQAMPSFGKRMLTRLDRSFACPAFKSRPYHETRSVPKVRIR